MSIAHISIARNTILIPNTPNLGNIVALPCDGFGVVLTCFVAIIYQVASWSLSRYTNWLENHPTEADRLTLIKYVLLTAACFIWIPSIRQGPLKTGKSLYGTICIFDITVKL